MNELASFFSTYWVIFSFSFMMALTGAMSPGPLLTYTIIQSIKTSRRGYLMGIWVIMGHAVLEIGIIIFLLIGLSFVLKNIIVVRTIGIVGGLILVYFGASIIRNVYIDNIPTSFLTSFDKQNQDSIVTKSKGMQNPIVGGIMISMSNPYWWVWWATIGFAFIIQFNISFRQWPRLIVFFLGHEAGDLTWYLIVSILAFFGIRHLNKKAYYGILASCGIFMILLGIYLGLSPFLKTSL
ncbi:LysE family transporter [Thermodesulfobacteriota bacterium]